MLHRDAQPVGAERLAQRRRERRGRVGAAGARQAAGVRARPEHRQQPARVRADLLGGHPRIAALAQQVRVGEQPAQVRVPGIVERKQPDRARRPAAAWTPAP